jgi:hypothetical protein
MIQSKPLTGQCPHCGAPAEWLAYHSRYPIRGGQIVIVYRKSYYNLCRPHGTLKGKTPAEAAGLTDHRWTLRELLTYNAAVISKIT